MNDGSTMYTDYLQVLVKFITESVDMYRTLGQQCESREISTPQLIVYGKIFPVFYEKK